jgi:hypothetical protein
MNNIIRKPFYTALAQVIWADKEEAFGIENEVFGDYQRIADTLAYHYADCEIVKVFDNRLNLMCIHTNS